MYNLEYILEITPILDYDDYIITGWGVKAFKDKKSGNYILDAEMYNIVVKTKDKKNQIEILKEDRKSIERLLKENKRQEKLEKKKQDAEWRQKQAEKEQKEKEKEQKQKEKEKNQAEKKTKKDKKQAERDELNRSWKSWKCNKYHDQVRACVNYYYELYSNVIDINKWYKDRGKLLNDSEDTDKTNSDKEESIIPWLPDKEDNYKRYEKDYVLDKINYAPTGVLIGYEDNWEQNPWHRQMWEYILEHPNGPYIFDSNENKLKPDTNYCKDNIIINLDKETQQAIKNAEKNINNEFLSGGEPNTIFKTEEELEIERQYVRAMSQASKDWQLASQTKEVKTDEYQVLVFDFKNYQYINVNNEELHVTKRKAIYNENKSVQENLNGMMSGVSSSISMIDQIITPKLTTYLTTYISNTLMTYTQQAIVQMLSFDPSEIASLAGKLTPNYIKIPSKILKELLTSTENTSQKQNEELEKEVISKINAMIEEGTGGISNFVMKLLEKSNNTIGAISYYSQMGPAWLNDRLNIEVTNILNGGFEYIGKARDFVELQKNKMIENISDNMARKLAIKANNKMEKEIKAKLDAANNKKQEAISKAKVNTLNAKVKILGILGL